MEKLARKAPWHTGESPDAHAELVRLEALEAEIHEPLKDVGGGIKVAAVKDPFGNVFGIIENPQFQPRDVR